MGKIGKSWHVWSNDEFVNTIKEKHKDKTNLSFDKVHLNGIGSYVTVTCCKHGDYKYKGYQLLDNNFQCKFCNREQRHYETAKMHFDKFISEAKQKWPNIDYSVTELPKHNERYIKFKINCPIHGVQEVIASTFLKHGCPKCESGIGVGKSTRRNYTNDEFIQELKNVYGDKYDYSEVNYVNWRTKVKLKCDKHGWFYREPIRLIHDPRGCPYCSKSLLENDLKTFLDKNEIEYIWQYKPTFLGLKSLDFYLPKFNVAIECQGRQHFYQNSIFNTKEKIENIIKYDEKKYNICLDNGLQVFYFTYMNYKKPYFTKLYRDKNELLNKILENHE